MKRQHQLRAQQLARHSPNYLATDSNQQSDLLEKGIFQDPFLGAGLLGSVLLTPSRLNLASTTDDKQQVNGASKKSVVNEIENGQSSKRQTFSVAAQAARAGIHLLHQQRNSTLRKQLAKRNLEQAKLKEQSSFDQDKLTSTTNKPTLIRFLKKSNAIRPVQLQHSLSLTSFAALPKNSQNQYNNQFSSQFSSPLNSHCNNYKLKLTSEVKPTKYPRIDKNVMTINQQPITLDLLYDNGAVQQQNQSQQFHSNRHLNGIKKTESTTQEHQPITWLDQSEYSYDLNDDELPLPVPLEILEKRKSNSPIKSRSMPMLINQPEHALPYYLDESSLPEHPFLINDQLDNYTFNSFHHHLRNDNYTSHTNHCPSFSDNETEMPCALHSSISHLLQHNSQDDTINVFQQQDQRNRFINNISSFGSNKRINAHNLDQQWPDAQLQQFLNAFNHYTEQQPSSHHRNHTRSLFDL